MLFPDSHNVSCTLHLVEDYCFYAVASRSFEDSSAWSQRLPFDARDASRVFLVELLKPFLTPLVCCPCFKIVQQLLSNLPNATFAFWMLHKRSAFRSPSFDIVFLRCQQLLDWYLSQILLAPVRAHQMQVWRQLLSSSGYLSVQRNHKRHRRDALWVVNLPPSAQRTLDHQHKANLQRVKVKGKRVDWGRDKKKKGDQGIRICRLILHVKFWTL